MYEAGQCSARLTALYGEDPAAARGVLHVMSCWSAPDGTLRAIRIAPGSPQSGTDRFVLSAARARADAIVTTGKTLRDEPAVEHGPIVRDAALRRALAAWRSECAGRVVPARSVVLSSGRDLDLAHPILAGASGALISTGEEAAAALRERAAQAEKNLEVIGRARPGLRDTVSFLRRERGFETVLVEAGPSTALELYRAPVGVDELLLSIYEESRLEEPLIGPAFLPLARLGDLFARQCTPHRTLEESGRWSFRRLRR